MNPEPVIYQLLQRMKSIRIRSLQLVISEYGAWMDTLKIMKRL